MPPGFTFEASYDGIRIDVLSSTIRHGRSVVAHRFPKRDGATNEDMGREQFVCTLQFLFIDHRFVAEGEGNYADRFRAFSRLLDEGRPRVLVHPYEGAVRCNVGEFAHDADGTLHPVINASATFSEEIDLPPVFVAGAGAQTRASAQDVRAEAIQAEASLDEIGADPSTVRFAADEAARWESDPDLSAREVQLQMAVINQNLNRELDKLGVATDLSRHPLHKQYTRLQHSLRRAAEAFTTTTTRIVTINVLEPLPLRVIAARFYGAEQAERRFREMRELNPAIPNPAIIAAGTELKAYSRGTAPRRFVQ
jgi:prophage DNA circulation protein